MTQAFERLKEMTPTISVGIISADLLNLGSQISILEQAGVRLLHVDVMDGCFVPQLTVGPAFIKALKRTVSEGGRSRPPLLIDAHLMIQDPLTKVGDYVSAGADLITVHLESDIHIHRVLQQIKLSAASASREVIRGIALNPGTPLETLEPLFDEIEMILLLAINPGWGGQSFIANSRARLKRLKEMISASGRLVLTILDGGITRDNIEEVAAWGADIVVSGSAVFQNGAAVENARFMMNALRIHSK